MAIRLKILRHYFVSYHVLLENGTQGFGNSFAEYKDSFDFNKFTETTLKELSQTQAVKGIVILNYKEITKNEYDTMKDNQK